MKTKTRLVGAISALTAAVMLANVRLEFPGESQGPPAYAQLQSGNEFYHTDDWVGIPFYRELGCVPPGFNLLQVFDFPAAFQCALAVQGFEIRRSLAPADFLPIHARIWGLGAVPVLFVSRAELQAAVADGNLSLSELRSLSSTSIGYANYFSLVIHPSDPPAGAPQDHVEISARGVLQDGRQFQFQVSAGERPGADLRHVKIRFW